jgi:accessory colonization factor AcfC
MKKEMAILGRLCTLLLAVFVLAAAWCSVPVFAADLKVYVPGGLKYPAQECAKAFNLAHSIKVSVSSGEGPEWMDEATEAVDIILLGAAHVYSLFALKYSGAIGYGGWEGLYMRPAGILVRKGNPKGIKGLEDLAKPGLRLLNAACLGQAGVWEDVAGRKGLIEAILKNFAVTVPSGLKGIEVWKGDATLDAWVTFASFHYMQKGVTDLVEIPDKDNVFRSTLVGITSRCKDPEAAAGFMRFLKSDEAHAIFRKWGWR